MAYRIDLHTHSTASPDGALRASSYAAMLSHGVLDAIAVTDHNTITLAQELHATLGDRIIVGEEITTSQGELIGLYLQTVVPPFLSVLDTIRRIHEQGGLVYVPHPFETVRKGIPLNVLDELATMIDIIEVGNGRAVFQNRSLQAAAWAQNHNVAGAASSDAHGRAGWGRTYTTVTAMPTVHNLVNLLKTGECTTRNPGMAGLAYPKFNRLRKWKWGI
jgi:predicted metal-dependent phosphoesterase TrpH